MQGRLAVDMHPAWLLILVFHIAWALLPQECSFAQPDSWLSHCEAANDCTSEAEFCGCCAQHPYTEYADACAAICPVLLGKFEWAATLLLRIVLHSPS